MAQSAFLSRGLQPFTYKPLPPLNLAPLTPPKRSLKDSLGPGGGELGPADPPDEFDAIDVAYDTLSPNKPISFENILDAIEEGKKKTGYELTFNQLTDAQQGRKYGALAGRGINMLLGRALGLGLLSPVDIFGRVTGRDIFSVPSYEDLVSAFEVPDTVAALGAMEAGPFRGSRYETIGLAGLTPEEIAAPPPPGHPLDTGPWGTSSDVSGGQEGSHAGLTDYSDIDYADYADYGGFDMGMKHGGIVTLQGGGDLMKQDGHIDLRLPDWSPSNPLDPTLANMTTADWLFFHAPGYRGVGRASVDPAHRYHIGASLVPSNRALPEASVGIQGAVEDPSVTGTASVGNRLLRYSKSAKKGPGPDPVEITDTVEANLGPVSLYKKWGSRGSETGAHGTIPVGLGSLSPFWKREQRGPDAVRTLGAHGKIPLGPGILGLQGSMADIRGVGRQTDLSGTYNRQNIFGLGGSGSVTGFYRVPPSLFKKYGAEDEYGVGFRWGKSF